MIDVSELNAAINELIPRIGVEITAIQRKLVLDILRGVVLKTPVDTGRARANWQVTIGEDITTEAANGNPVAKAAADLASLPPFSVAFVVNNVPYIAVLEFGLFDPKNPGPTKDKKRKGKVLVREGFSVQAPAGMVRLTLDEITRSIKNG